MGKDLASTLKDLNKEFGEGTAETIGDRDIADIDVIDTNCLSLNYVFGCDGMPRGRIIECFGQESSGKSTLAMFLVAQVQKAGGTAVWIDAEASFTKDYAQKVGVDTDSLILNQPSYGEEGLKVLRKTVESGEVDIVVVDSVAALVPKKELDGEISDQDVALQARMMGKTMRIIAGVVSQTDTVVIFINQLRQKIGVFFGKKELTPGGKALKFYASTRLEVRKGKNIPPEKEAEVLGNWMHVTAVKNKVGMPFRKVEFELFYGSGVDTVGDVLDFGVRQGVIKRAGSSYSYIDTKLGAGRENAKKFLRENEDMLVEISGEIRKTYERKQE